MTDRRTLLLGGLALGGAAMVRGEAVAQTAAAAMPVPTGAAILPLLERSAVAEIAKIKGRVGSGAGVFRFYSPNWIVAAFLVGVARLSRVSTDRAFFDHLELSAETFNFALRGPGTARGLLNADDQAIGDLYQEVYARTRLPGMLLPLQQRLDYNLPYLAFEPAPKRLIWWWCDALFMAPPVLARMSALTGNARYLDAMDVQWWRTYDRLWDRQESLYYRDERFVTRRSETGAKIFWSRGNGWVAAGLCRVLETMPADYRSRPRYVALLRAMATRIAALQAPDGLWRASMLDDKLFPDTETSGSAFFVYALAFGVNHGLLDRRTYEPHIARGWAGLMRNVLPDGMLGMVQRAGDRPVPSRLEDTAPYASGAFLLAGLEVMRLGSPVSPLPVPEPARDPAYRIKSDMGPNRPAQNPTQAAENVRRDEERQAMEDYPFDPVTDDPAYRSPVGVPRR